MTQTPNTPRHRVVPLAVLATLGATTGIGAPAAAAPPTVRVNADAPQPTTAAAPVRGQSTYTVKPGDTLGAISRATGVLTADLRAANGLSGDHIVAGKTLVIPARSSGGSTQSGGTIAGRASGSYTVRPGDTISAIAGFRGTTTNAILAANPGVNARALRPGQKLVIPSGGAGTGSSSPQRVPNTFAGRSYPQETVRSANLNKQALHERHAPSSSEMQRIIRQTANRHGVDPRLALAISHQESGFNMRAVSPANAVGAMQVIPSSGEWASRMAGRTLDLMDPQDNATAGVLIIKAHQRTGADESIVIASYYQGRGSVTRNGMYADTKRYVANVQALKGRY